MKKALKKVEELAYQGQLRKRMKEYENSKNSKKPFSLTLTHF